MNLRRVSFWVVVGSVLLAGGFRLSAAEGGGLNGAAGKVFDVNLKDKSFRFLKQDVSCDPKTGEGTAWYTVHWAEDTTFRQYEELVNFSESAKKPVIAEFTGLDDANAKALREGKTFRADNVVLRPDLKEGSGIAADGRSVVGWFTPRVAKFSRDGLLKLGDRDIKAGTKYGGIRITIQRVLTAEDMAKGFWKATLTGRETNGGFVATHIRLEPLPNPFAVDDPKLPRVLSVGDSVSLLYEQPARDDLKGVANYHHIEDNCWSTVRGKAFMAYWLGDYTRKGLGWDVILFNSGLHDLKQQKLGGPFVVSIPDYKKNLRQEIEIMQKTGAKLIWVTTTPVPNDIESPEYGNRAKGSETVFNQAAAEVLRDYPEIQVCDLAKVVNESTVFDKWRKGHDVHYWTAEEQAVLGKEIANAVRHALGEEKK